MTGVRTNDKNDEKVCSHCDRRNDAVLRFCPCKMVRYCGTSCQHADWKAHQKVCKSLTVTKVASDEESAGCGSSEGLSDDGRSPARPKREPIPLSRDDIISLSETIERLAATSPSLLSAMVVDLVQLDPTAAVPVITNYLNQQPPVHHQTNISQQHMRGGHPHRQGGYSRGHNQNYLYRSNHRSAPQMSHSRRSGLPPTVPQQSVLTTLPQPSAMTGCDVIDGGNIIFRGPEALDSSPEVSSDDIALTVASSVLNDWS